MTDAPTSIPDSDLDPTDPYAREAQIFPRLGQEMARRIASYGTVEDLPAGTLVFERSQRSVDFFFVIDGNIEIFDVDEQGKPNVFTVHGVRQFTGELDLFNDRAILVSGRVGVDSRVVRVPRADFRRMVTGEPDIGEILMRAFILRRTGFIRHGQGGVVLIEGVAPGGQAGTSSKIENYLGFPTGISGQALAGRAQIQAQKLGAHLAISRNGRASTAPGNPMPTTASEVELLIRTQPATISGSTLLAVSAIALAGRPAGPSGLG